MQKTFKMPSAFTMLILIIVAVALLTWLIPAGQYQLDDNGSVIAGTYERVKQNPQGFWQIIMAPVKGMLGTDSTPGAIDVAVFILVIGGFLGVVARTGAIDTGIASLVTKYRGRERQLIPLLMIVFALGGTSYGMAEETIAFYPLIVPIMVMAGFDTITAASVIMLGAGMGVLGSTVNPFATGVASQAAGISVGDGMLWRVLILVISVGVTIAYVMRYSKKVQLDTSKSLVADNMVEDKKYFAVPVQLEKMTTRQVVVLIIFTMSFLTMVLGLIPWNAINEQWTFFDRLNEAIISTPFLGALIGTSMLPFGAWYFQEITSLFFIAAIIIGLVYHMKELDIVDSFVAGARDLLSVAFIVGLARGIQVIMNDGQMTATILNFGENTLSALPPALFGIFSFIFYILMSFLIPSTSGLASATMAIMGPLASLVGVEPHVVVTAFQSASGMVNVITPTSATVMGALALAHVPYDRWFKFVGKLLLIIFVINAIIIAWAAVAS